MFQNDWNYPYIGSISALQDIILKKIGKRSEKVGLLPPLQTQSTFFLYELLTLFLI